jgi:hypothetical protein
MHIWTPTKKLTRGGWSVLIWLLILMITGFGAYGLWFASGVEARPEHVAELERIRNTSYGCLGLGALGAAAWFWLRRN